MGIASFYDFQISSMLYNSNNLFGRFFAIYGQLPAILLISLCGSLLIACYQNEHIKSDLWKGSSLLVISFLILVINQLEFSNLSVFICLIISGLLIFMVYLLTIKYIHANRATILKTVKWILLVLVLELVIVEILKGIWERPRMRFIPTHDVTFAPWWQIGGDIKEGMLAMKVNADEFKSFPSGHTAHAATIFVLPYLSLLFPIFKGKEKMLSIVALIFALFVGCSRIVMGAHFLSDITIGMSVTLLIIILSHRFYLRTSANH